MSSYHNVLKEYIKPGKVMVFSATWCPYCTKAKETLTDMGIKFDVLETDINPLPELELDRLDKVSGIESVPKIFVGNQCVGGNSDMEALIGTGDFQELLTEEGIIFRK